MGCNCCCNEKATACQTKPSSQYKIYLPAFTSLLMLVAGVIANHFGLFSHPGISLAWYALAYLPVGLPVLKEAYSEILKKEYFNEFTLMTIATIGAFWIGEYPEGVAVMLFYSIGEIFQGRAVGKARKSIKALLDVRPESATVIRNGVSIATSPHSVKVGEIIEVKVGERVPLDARMLEEKAAFNTAALTGESVPRTIRKGESVLAGMIVTGEVVRLEVERPFEDSALSRILKMVQEATERKAPTELFIRRFARVYTPIVTLLALLIVVLPLLYSYILPFFTDATFHYVFSDWLYRGLVFLVISCPCALVVSIPLGYFGGIGAASRVGILFKGSNYLDAITKINTVVFDKTGTLTKGVFEVQQVETAQSTDEKELLQYVAAAEQQSTHPIARAVTEYAQKQSIRLDRPEKTEEIPGHGIKCFLYGKEVLVGNRRLLQRYDIAFPQELASVTDTLVVCAVEGRYIGHLLLADTPKEDAPQAIRSLKALNIPNIEVLSGDKQAIVSKLAGRLGIEFAFGDLLPEGKVEHIETLKTTPGNRIAFVGDGLNDAPVLAASHIGIAMGGLGSDAAIETADIVIQTDQPSKIATAIRIGKATRQIVWQNIALAFGVKFAILCLGAFGIATLWEAVFADVGVALLAILNAIRIKAPHV